MAGEAGLPADEGKLDGLLRGDGARGEAGSRVHSRLDDHADVGRIGRTVGAPCIGFVTAASAAGSLVECLQTAAQRANNPRYGRFAAGARERRFERNRKQGLRRLALQRRPQQLLHLAVWRCLSVRAIAPGCGEAAASEIRRYLVSRPATRTLARHTREPASNLFALRNSKLLRALPGLGADGRRGFAWGLRARLRARRRESETGRCSRSHQRTS